MDLRNLPTANRHKVRQCECGCDSFRFKINTEWSSIENDKMYSKLCRNCNHTLTEHIVLPSAEE